MFIQLKNHKAHVFEHNKSDEIASNIFIIHGAGMDHRIGSMIDLSKFNSSHNIYSIDLPGHGFTSGAILHTVEEMAAYVFEIINEMNADNNIFIGPFHGRTCCHRIEFKNEL
jgi:pimeloyl-ACP methyl ester carboxylesterase